MESSKTEFRFNMRINNQMINPEKLFQLLEDRNWDAFLKLLQNHKEEIQKNPVATQALNYFHVEYEKDIDNEKLYSVDSLRTIYLFHSAHLYKFPKNIFNKAMEKLLQNYRKESLKKAFELATSINNVPKAKEIIKEYKKTQPTKVSHSQSNNISLIKNKIDKPIGKTINLFKSNEEKYFFQAVVSVFPNYHTYPNVAVSCLVDFDSIKEKLNNKERGYFFTAIVDCVVFDISDGYKPIYFFEVDSIFHDRLTQKEKDSMKDKFFSLCGETLYRIRSIKEKSTKENYKQLITENIARNLTS